jgi:hypothetical protein
MEDKKTKEELNEQIERENQGVRVIHAQLTL